MKLAYYELRLFITEILLSMALRVVPAKSKEAISLGTYIKSFYLEVGKKVDKP